VLSDLASAPSRDVVAAVNGTRGAAAQNEALGGVHLKALNGIFVEGKLGDSILDQFYAFCVQRGPDPDALVGTAADDLLSTVREGELRANDFFFVTHKVGHHFAIHGIDHPDHVVFAARQKQRSGLMPFHEV